MVSKPRLALGMLVLAALAGGLLALLISLDVGAFWAKTLPLVFLAGGAALAQSLGLFTKAPKD
ncbi:hypothetical protein SAMN04489729_3409 [Amycolatopsis lurida]|uniref:Integral membrane protein n=1 Tax=Amycolatopsis lurida NRRL 2430 TaxID=1460371 RepID=A0A2P2FRR1_AMYLU|nr:MULTISPECIES: hypothetical protein [Amycolatopsis]KFU79408.1 hypothetical protein BB31_21035 [Amycolatopsis lurida NRRL 2430]QXV59394.1 hypothetical protein CVV72_21890 [Amycolatopsis sp. TNS106]SED11629.1 hypothetical protein SAMN04489729_3409 [Amycolatopsis lurida]